MPVSGPLYERVATAPPIPSGLPLVIVLTGFTDAGNAASRMVAYFRDDLDPTPVLTFSADVLLDYRARRPLITFEADHLTAYRPPRLELSLAHDSLGSRSCSSRATSPTSPGTPSPRRWSGWPRDCRSPP